MKSTVCHQLEMTFPKKTDPIPVMPGPTENFQERKIWQTNGWSCCETVQQVHTRDTLGAEEKAGVSRHINVVP